MPVTHWDDIVGYRCVYCNGYATHWYGDSALCCDCHAGPGQGLISQEEAQRKHEKVFPPNTE